MGLLTEVAGWGGAGCLLLAYALLSAGRLASGTAFQLLNLAGAAGLLVNGAAHGAWPSAALNLVWLAVGVAALRTGGKARDHETERGVSRRPSGAGRCP